MFGIFEKDKPKCKKCGSKSWDYQTKIGDNNMLLYYIRCNSCHYTTDYYSKTKYALDEWMSSI